MLCLPSGRVSDKTDKALGATQPFHQPPQHGYNLILVFFGVIVLGSRPESVI